MLVEHTHGGVEYLKPEPVALAALIPLTGWADVSATTGLAVSS
jgi:hypothetical protein